MSMKNEKWGTSQAQVQLLTDIQDGTINSHSYAPKQYLVMNQIKMNVYSL